MFLELMYKSRVVSKSNDNTIILVGYVKHIIHKVDSKVISAPSMKSKDPLSDIEKILKRISGKNKQEIISAIKNKDKNLYDLVFNKLGMRITHNDRRLYKCKWQEIEDTDTAYSLGKKLMKKTSFIDLLVKEPKDIIFKDLVISDIEYNDLRNLALIEILKN